MQRSGIDPRTGGGGDASTATAPVAGDPVTIRNPDGTVVATAVSAEDGSFQVVVPAGLYSVTEDILGVSQTVDVADQATCSVVLLLTASN